MQYCGPGPITVPVSPAFNRLCRIHDADYSRIIETKGPMAAYIQFNWADAKFLKGIAKLGRKHSLTKNEQIAQAYFLTKQSASKSFL